MRKQTLVEGYAQAAYQAATEAWLKVLSQLKDSLTLHPGLMAELTDPGKSLAEKQAAVNQVLPVGVGPQVRNLVSTLLSQNDMALLPGIVDQFRRMVAGKMHQVKATITSAVALTDDEKAGLVGVLTAQYGLDLDFEYKVDPALIGGAVVRVGDRVIDGSVAHRLEVMRRQLAQVR